MSKAHDPFPEMANFTFGAMSLGQDIPQSMENDQAVARTALEAPIWLHASPTYSRGFAFMILRLVFDRLNRSPRMIIKIRDANPQLLRFEVEDACRRLGLETLDVAQLVAMKTGPGGIAEDLAGNGPVTQEITQLRDEGLLQSAVLFLRPEDAGAAEKAWPSGIIQGFTFYWNAVQCSCAPEDWAFLQREQVPVLALRTLAGGSPESVEEGKRRAYQQLLQDSGLADWTELNLRYAASEPLVRTSIGGTANPGHLQNYLKYATDPAPLDAELVQRIEELKRG
jgi:aryl-alcohol dehydrogenase-like predicted oxidoreductase